LSPPPESLADLLVTLVNIPSVSGEEHAIADYIETRLHATGRGPLDRTRRSVVWRGPETGRPLLVLAGHVDTVRPQDNGCARREERPGGAQILGLGSTDMKSGIAVMLRLAETLDLQRSRFDLACVFYDGEEGPSAKNGLRRVLARMRWLRKARLAVVLEPTALHVELGCNGTVNLEIRVPGVAAHAARPWTGRNAVTEGAAWLAGIGATPLRTVRVHGLEFRETLEVTRLRAGSARNVLPAEMLVNLNHRFPPDRTVDEAVERVSHLIPPKWQWKIRSSSPPGRVCFDDPEVQAFIQGSRLRVAGKQGWTDVARFTRRGIPAFNFGPGIPELCHRADEHCPVANLDAACERLERWIAG